VASFRKDEVTMPTFMPLSRASMATVRNRFVLEGSMLRMPFFVLKPEARAVPAAAESVTAPSAVDVDIFPRTGRELKDIFPAPEPRL
jgi:hypothetical protein